MSGVDELHVLRVRQSEYAIDTFFGVCKLCRTSRYVHRDRWDGRRKVSMCINGHSGFMGSVSPVLG